MVARLVGGSGRPQPQAVRRAESVSPLDALSTFAHLYGSTELEMLPTTEQMTAAWIVGEPDAAPLGALGLRSTPAHGSEVMGGALPGPEQQGAALALLQAALGTEPRLYAYAEEHLWPLAALQAAGLRPVGAYARLSGPVPGGEVLVPEGFRLVPISEASAADILAAQRAYEHRIGHTHVTPEAAELITERNDLALSRLAYDASGEAVGLCWAQLYGGLAAVDSPAVCPDLSGSGLREALLRSVCAAVAQAGAVHLTLESWGDTERERAHDLSLGLEVEELNVMYGTGVDQRQVDADDVFAQETRLL